MTDKYLDASPICYDGTFNGYTLDSEERGYFKFTPALERFFPSEAQGNLTNHDLHLVLHHKIFYQGEPLHVADLIIAAPTLIRENSGKAWIHLGTLVHFDGTNETRYLRENLMKQGQVSYSLTGTTGGSDPKVIERGRIVFIDNPDENVVYFNYRKDKVHSSHIDNSDNPIHHAYSPQPDKAGIMRKRWRSMGVTDYHEEQSFVLDREGFYSFLDEAIVIAEQIEAGTFDRDAYLAAKAGTEITA